MYFYRYCRPLRGYPHHLFFNWNETMRLLITECYVLFYKTTRAKLLAYWLGLAYVTILTFMGLQGLFKLTTGWLSFAPKLQILFRVPVCFVTLIVMFLLIYKVSPKMSQLSKDAKKGTTGFATILALSVFMLILWLYTNFGDSFFS